LKMPPKTSDWKMRTSKRIHATISTGVQITQRSADYSLCNSSRVLLVSVYSHCGSSQQAKLRTRHCSACHAGLGGAPNEIWRRSCCTAHQPISHACVQCAHSAAD
jgi:hypothetical protein